MDVLASALLRSAQPRAPSWVFDAVAGRAPSGADLALAFSAASYAVGRARVTLDASETAAAHAAGAPWMARGATLDVLARVALVRAVAGGGGLAAVRKLFTSGDNEERAAVLRALPLLADPAAFVPLATEGCRTNVKTVFEAIACDSAYPARHLEDAAFNQMVLKAVFIGTPVARIEGLASRTSDELRRMARGYASERTAAGRSVPEDIHTLLASATGGPSS